MLEYRVRAVREDATGDMEKLLNDYAKEAWRLVSTEVFGTGTFRPQLFLFFERDGGQPESQDVWAAQHGRPG